MTGAGREASGENGYSSGLGKGKAFDVMRRTIWEW